VAEQELETRQEAMKEGGEATFWQRQLELSDKDHEAWLKQGDDVVERYKGASTSTSKDARKKANILYSNTEVLKAALFAKMAKPDVRRRFSDQDPTGRIVAELLERALIYTNDCNDSESQIGHAIEDYCLPGRGIERVHYEAKTGSAGPDSGESEQPADVQDGQAAAEAPEYVTEQEVWDEYVNWKDYRHEPTPNWDKLTWEAYRHLMTLDDLEENFGSNTKLQIDKVPLNWAPDSGKKTKVPESFKRAEVWEVWDKATRTRIWIVKGFDQVLRKDKDPYGLEDFFPRPRPLQATTTTDTVIPQPEFLSYKDQADALDEIETRIDRLTKALKRRGMYNANIPELKKLATLGDNQFVPGEKWSEFAAGGGLKGNFETEDFSVAANVLDQLHAQRAQRIQAIYEIMGIADVMRGVTDPSETLGAQQLKAQFGGNRLKKRQDAVQKFIRDLMRVKAEIVAEHFEPERLSEMTGFPWQPTPPMPAPMMAPQMSPGGPPAADQMATPQPQQMGSAPPEASPPGMGMDQAAAPEQAPDQRVITPEIMEILRTDRLRSYRVDVETDSTIYEDAEAERTSRVELLTAMTQFVGGWLPIVQGEPALMPLAFEMLAFGVRGFKTGRMLEEAIEQTRMQLEQASKQQVEPPPDPAVQAEQAKLQVAQQKNQQDAQLAQAKMQQDSQAKQAEMALQDKHHTEQMQLEFTKLEKQHALEIQKMEREHEMRFKEMEHQAREGQEARGLDRMKFESQIVHDYDRMDMEEQQHGAQLSFSKEDAEANRAASMYENEASRTASKEDGDTNREFEREKVGLPTREGKDFFVEVIETISEAFSKTAEASEKNTAVLADVADKFGDVATAMEEIASDAKAPVQFESGPDGRISGFTKGKRKVGIKRDPKTGKMQGAH
jgi:hypothetical protein